MAIKMVNKEFGKEVNAPTGFSWTTCFFGLFVPLVRGNMKQTAIWFVAIAVTGGLAFLAMPFLINKYCIKDLVAKGYVPVADADTTQLKQMEISLKSAA